jgi:hypothetical protein
MSTTFNCEDKDTLVAFLYDDEIDDALRREVTAHLRTCTACASEVDGLRAVRRDVLAWQPPETELNFAIVQKPATVLRPARWPLPALPAWAQVAAAALVFAAGAAIANVQVRYNSEGVTMTTGWMAQPPTPITTVATPPAEDWRPALTALESELRRELQLVRSTQTGGARAASAAAPVDANTLMRRVRAEITESEQRQRQELALRLTQLGREVQTDFVRVNQGFRQLQGRTGLVEGRQSEMLNYFRRVATQQVP